MFSMFGSTATHAETKTGLTLTPVEMSSTERKSEPTETTTAGDVKKPAVSTALIAMRGLLGKRTMRTGLGYISTVITQSTGAINQTISVSGVASTSEFAACAALFDEFYVHSMTLTYEPLDQFQDQPVASLASPSSSAIYGAPLYHGASTYTSASVMANNVGFRVLYSGRPWRMVWKNNESSKSTVASSSTTSTPLPCQGWCLTNSSAAVLYTGLIQLRNNTVLGTALSSTVGDLAVQYDVEFRARS